MIKAVRHFVSARSRARKLGDSFKMCPPGSQVLDVGV